MTCKILQGLQMNLGAQTLSRRIKKHTYIYIHIIYIHIIIIIIYIYTYNKLAAKGWETRRCTMTLLGWWHGPSLVRPWPSWSLSSPRIRGRALPGRVGGKTFDG